MMKFCTISILVCVGYQQLLHFQKLIYVHVGSVTEIVFHELICENETDEYKKWFP